MGVWATARWWVLTRSAAIVIFILEGARARNDVWYFSRSLGHLHHRGLGHTLVEYPLPAVAVIAVPWLVARAVGLAHAYVPLFAAAALTTDAVFTLLLAKLGVDRSGVAFWLLGVPLLGAMSYFRFDPLPAVLVGVAVLLLASRPRLAMLCVSVATAVKLWPALAIPPLLAGLRRRWQGAGVVLVAGGVLAGVTVVVAGWARLVSPLTYESDRGLQIESVWATPAMVAWSLASGGRFTTHFRFHSWEVFGPWVHALLTVSSVSLLVLAVALVALWWRLLRHPTPLSGERVVWATLAGVSGFLVVGKVLSPQYLIWLLAIAAAGLAVTGAGSQRLVRWTTVLLVAAGLTQLVFPISYAGLHHHDWHTPYAVPLLVLRNGALLWLLGVAWVNAWRPDPTQPREVPESPLPLAV